MKQYPSISKTIINNISVMVFPKYDGSNIRCEWNKKNGLYKFGSRTQLLSESQGIIYKAKSLIKCKEEQLSNLARSNCWERCVFFFEFFGPNSFAGNHNESDEHIVKLIDINIYKKGFISPKEFIKIPVDLRAELIYHGQITPDIITKIKQGTFDGMTKEGVICKANNPKNKHNPIMFKIKSDLWINKLKHFCGKNEKLFKILS